MEKTRRRDKLNLGAALRAENDPTSFCEIHSRGQFLRDPLERLALFPKTISPRANLATFRPEDVANKALQVNDEVAGCS